MSRGVAVASIFSVLVGACELHADMGVPAFKRVEQRMRFENVADFPEFDFFLGIHYELDPRNNSGHHLPCPIALKGGSAVSHQAFFSRPDRGLYVVIAVPRSKSSQVAWSATWDTLAYGRPDILHSEPIHLRLEEAIFFSPHEYDLHRYRVNISDGRLTLEFLGVEDNCLVIGGVKLPTWSAGVALSALFVGVVLWCIRRQRRPQA
jgi:hypothetical protein